MITLISTPEYVDPADPSVICRWLATESPNNFRLLRRDFIVVVTANSGGFLQIILDDSFTGNLDDVISVYNVTTNSMYVGAVVTIGTSFVADDLITTDIPFVAGMNIAYLNDNTLHAGYYFEGQLTINGVVYPLTIISSPDSFGYADLDVSGVLRIVTSLGKIGDYTSRIMSEPNKSGKFTFEFRECWYGYEGVYEGDVVTSPPASPPIMNDWYYGECVRSEEQGSNLHDFVADALNDAPFLNSFDQPVYFLGLPFDLSFILPEQALVSPMTDITVTIKIYDSNNILLTTITELIDANSFEGYICSLTLDAATIPINANYLTAEITV